MICEIEIGAVYELEGYGMVRVFNFHRYKNNEYVYFQPLNSCDSSFISVEEFFKLVSMKYD